MEKKEENPVKGENITRPLPDIIIQSALSIVESLASPHQTINTPNGARPKQLPSPHLFFMESDISHNDKTEEISRISRETQTLNEEEVDEHWMEKYNELMNLYQLKVQEAQGLSDQLFNFEKNSQVRYSF